MWNVTPFMSSVTQRQHLIPHLKGLCRQALCKPSRVSWTWRRAGETTNPAGAVKTTGALGGRKLSCRAQGVTDLGFALEQLQVEALGLDLGGLGWRSDPMVDRVNFYKRSPAMFFSDSPPKPNKPPDLIRQRTCGCAWAVEQLCLSACGQMGCHILMESFVSFYPGFIRSLVTTETVFKQDHTCCST